MIIWIRLLYLHVRVFTDYRAICVISVNSEIPGKQKPVNRKHADGNWRHLHVYKALKQLIKLITPAI